LVLILNLNVIYAVIFIILIFGARMKVEFHSLHWDNVDPKMLEAHKKVMDNFDIPINYWSKNISHGAWLDHIMRKAISDIVVIIEPDCVPIYKRTVHNLIKYVELHDTFVGIAQVANHIPPKSHIYAAPGFYAMTKSVYERLGEPSFMETSRSDVAEEVSYIAELKGIRYRALLPTSFEKEPDEGLWPLGSIGYYGIGTVFNHNIYHLYQSRMAQNVDRFVTRCEQIVQNKFSEIGFYNSQTLGYNGNIVK
jgi:hypothetical protein